MDLTYDDEPQTPITPAPSRLPRPSRLPVAVRRVSSTIPGPPSPLLPQSSRERLPGSGYENKIPTPRATPTIAKRASISRLVAPQDDVCFIDPTTSSLAKISPRKSPSNGMLNSNIAGPTLKGRTSANNLHTRPASLQLSRKASDSLIGSPRQSPTFQTSRSNTPQGRRTSDINGATSPALNHRTSNTQLRQPSVISKRQSLSQLSVSQVIPTPKSTPRLAIRPLRPKSSVPALPTSDAPKRNDHRQTSQSLRDTIRQARAAKQRAPTLSQGDGDVAVTGLDGFEFGAADPFGQGIGDGGSLKVILQRIKTARAEGKLNISNLLLKEIPVEVYKMYEATDDDLSADNDGPKWYESVDLTRLIGADNEIETIEDELVEKFGALSVIDMHNNLLNILPSNLSQLTELTVLNLSNNKLDNRALDIIFQIATLKELKLSKNNLEGELDPSISCLTALESLELQDNKLTSLPLSIGDCFYLRELNIARNALTELPLEELRRAPLYELDASQNKLSGVFFPDSVECWDSLRVLNLKGNRLTSLSESSVVLPGLTQLIASNNQLNTFPTVDGWNELLVLLVDDNQIATLPDELYSLGHLRTLEFSGNNVKVLDPRIGGMDSLEIINAAGNPLSDRRLAGMSAADLKKTLRGRMAPEIVIGETEDCEFDERPGTAGTDSAAKDVIEVGRGGVVDLSKKGMSEISEELINSIVGSPYTILLGSNSFTVFPSNLDRFTSLVSIDLTGNRLVADYLTSKVTLNSLEILNLHNTGISSLTPLFEFLDAPKLQTLDISANRVPSIVGLRETFQELINFHAADNQIGEIPLESIDGIRVLDLSGNAITTLPPKLALCENLRDLRVQGNLFRVPRWQVLEKGTDAVLAWLRDRLPFEDGEEEEEL